MKSLQSDDLLGKTLFGHKQISNLRLDSSVLTSDMLPEQDDETCIGSTTSWLKAVYARNINDAFDLTFQTISSLQSALNTYIDTQDSQIINLITISNQYITNLITTGALTTPS